MSRRSRSRSRRLALHTLESRVVPVTDFQITGLAATGGATAEYSAIDPTDQGGIAVSTAKAFVTAASSTVRFDVGNLANTTAGGRLDGLAMNLNGQTVFDLGVSGSPINAGSINGLGTSVTDLLGVDPSTGALTGSDILLSSPILVRTGTGIFAGYDRIVLAVPNFAPGTATVYQIDLSSGNVGNVTTLAPSMANLPHQSSNTWAYWGTAEHFGGGAGNDFIDYVQDTTHVARENVQAGTASNIATFSNLSNMAAFTVDLANNRWYFHNDGISQFSAGSPSDQIIGYEPATFQIGSFVVTNLNNSGSGSLRDVVALATAAGPDNVVSFQAGLTGTIDLTTNPPIPVTQPVDIEGPGSFTITVTGASGNNLFAPSNGVTLTVHGLTLSNPAGLTVGYPVDVKGDVTFTAGSSTLKFNNLTITGSSTATAGSAVTLGPSTTVNGSLTATNAAGFTLPASDTLDGTGFVIGSVTDAGTLEGTLTIAGNVTVQNGGSVSPGNSSAANVTVNGNVVFQAGGTFAADFNGNGNNDRITVNGTVDIGTGNILVPTFGYFPSPNDTFLLIDNDQSDAITGTLNGVRNRSGEKLNNEFFQVRYDGNTGNDLELVANSAPVLDTSVQVKLDPITENIPPNSNPGTTVDSLVNTNNLYSDQQGKFRSGLAFIGTDTANGNWQFSRNGGTTWTNFGTLSDSSATLLEADGSGQNKVRFNPAVNFFGTATITFRGWDTTNGLADGSTGIDDGGSLGFNANSPYSSASVNASIAVLAVNQPPTPVNDSYTTAEDTALSVNAASGVLTNDTDPDGPFPLTAAIVSGPAHGTLTLNPNGSFTYTPAANYNGTDSFTYKAVDGDGAYGVAVATITITPVNDPPTVVNDTATVPEDGGAVPIDVLNNDSDAPDTGETLTITSVTQPANGTVTIINNGTKVSYKPNSLFFGSDSFTYTVTDNGTTNGNPDPKSSTGSVAVTVTFVNHPPVANGDTASVNEDAGAQTIDVLANDTDVDPGDTRTVTGVSQGLHGTVAIINGGAQVSYTPTPEFSGTDQFVYTITDSHGSSSNAIVNVTVNSNLDDRLEVDTTPGLTTFTEKVPPPSTAVAVDPGIQIGSGLEGVITGATVRITAGAVAKKDLLTFATFTTAAGTPIKGTYSPSTFALNLTGVGTQADYQAALRTVMFLNKSPAPVDGIRQVAFQLKDGAGAGPVGYKSVQVIGVNTAPVLSPTTGSKPAKFTIGKPAVAVAGTMKIVDVDNTRMQGATVSIDPADFQLNDVLTAITTKTAIHASYNTSTGVLTLTGNDTIANYLKVLKSVKFSTTTAGSGNRTISFSVTDGNLTSNVVTRGVTIS
jgi:VCBS repeat-containing protein